MPNIAIITGASSGIGRSLTLELASRGIVVIAIARNAHELEKIRLLHLGRIIAMPADITTRAGRSTILHHVEDYHTQGYKISYLIHNAGVITPIAPMSRLSEGEIRNIIETNLMAPILLTNQLLSLFDEKGTRILNITSVAGQQAILGLGSYCISKAALNMWTDILRTELPPYCLVADVIPGEVATNMQRDLREAPVKLFPLATQFKEAEQKETLISPDVCARFLTRLLLEVSPKEYTSKKWNIYEDCIEPLPLPLDKEKLAKKQDIKTSNLRVSTHTCVGNGDLVQGSAKSDNKTNITSKL